MRRIIVAFLVVTVMMLSVGLAHAAKEGEPAKAKEPIKIGAMFALSGLAAPDWHPHQAGGRNGGGPRSTRKGASTAGPWSWSSATRRAMRPRQPPLPRSLSTRTRWRPSLAPPAPTAAWPLKRSWRRPACPPS